MASIIATNVLNPINASHCWANNGSLQPIVNGLRIIQLESNEKINNCKDPLFIISVAQSIFIWSSNRKSLQSSKWMFLDWATDGKT